MTTIVKRRSAVDDLPKDRLAWVVVMISVGMMGSLALLIVVFAATS